MSLEKGNSRMSFSIFLNFVLDNTTCHGGNWASKIQWKPLRLLLQTVFMFVQFFLVIFVVWILVTNEPWLQKSTLVTRDKKSEMQYPNFTVCNPNPFDKQRVSQLGLTQTELTLLALPMFAQDGLIIMNELEKNQAFYENKISDLAAKHNLTELLNSVVLKCSKFIRKCLYKDLIPVAKQCCGEMFDPKPFLSKYGVCFTTKNLKTSTAGNLQVVLNMNFGIGFDKNITGIEISLITPTLAFNGKNHPLVAMEKNPESLKSGTWTSFKLSQSMVRSFSCVHLSSFKNY